MSKSQKSNGPETLSADLKAQRDYAKSLASSGFDFSLVIADAFVRGIRDIGYKHTGTALYELIDNAIQAEATKIHVVFDYDAGSDKKPDRLAVIDNGHGMDPDMIRAAVLWGGTHRENDRAGFGRYGYGLPSASVSAGRRFTVYSTPRGGSWHKVTIDVDDIGEGKLTNNAGKVVVPPAETTDLPKWVQAYMKATGLQGESNHGTVVLIEKLDRLTWKTTATLERKLLEHFGITYRNFLRQVEIKVNEKQVDPTDPLFLSPGFRFYDLDEDRAEAYPPLMFEVKDRAGNPQTIKVRYSYMPPTFQRIDKSKPATKKNENARFPIMKEHNGIIVLRNGRQVDVVRHCDETTFLTYDRNWGVDIDFPAALDEEFTITTSKQQVGLTERMWDILKKEGLWTAIEQMRSRHKEEVALLKKQSEEDAKKKRASEQAMEDAEKFKTRKPGGEPEERVQESQREFEKEVKRRSEAAGLPPEDVEKAVKDEIEFKKYKVSIESAPGAPFYRLVQLGGQKVLYINSAHRFFTDVYAGPDSKPRFRACLEVLLFVLGETELEATKERRLFYEGERQEWSKRLSVALDLLEDMDSVEEDEAFSAEETTSAA
jgi:hypothetical protein